MLKGKHERLLTFDFLFSGYSHKFRLQNLNQLHMELPSLTLSHRGACNQLAYIATLHAVLNMMDDLMVCPQPLFLNKYISQWFCYITAYFYFCQFYE